MSFHVTRALPALTCEAFTRLDWVTVSLLLVSGIGQACHAAFGDTGTAGFLGSALTFSFGLIYWMRVVGRYVINELFKGVRIERNRNEQLVLAIRRAHGVENHDN